jgi:regulatory protein YycI of two-component signal transduction system YycFG
MDFKKIENIFLVAFILLNIYLLISFLNRYDLQYASTTPDQVNVLREMEQRGIELPVFEEEVPEVYTMQADSHNLLQEHLNELEGQAGLVNEDGSFYRSLLSEPIELEGSIEGDFTPEDQETLDEFVNSSAVLFGQEYRFARFDSGRNRFVYYQSVDGLPVADGTSELSLYVDPNGEVFSYEQTYAGPMTQQGSPLEIISARAAVETLFTNNELNSNVTVHQPVLTYYRTLQLEDLSLYGPLWLIRVSSSSGTAIFRVEATTGAIIQEEIQPTTPSEEELEEELEEEIEIDEEVPDQETDETASTL